MSQMPLPPMNPNSGMMRPHRGTMILVFGILSLVIGCTPLGIAAWIMGAADLREMDMGAMDPSGREVTKVGRILGIIATCLALLVFLAWGAMFVLALVGVAAGAAGNHP